MNTSFSYACTVQGRVIWALMLREIQVMQGNTSLGYVWELLKSAFFLAVLWVLRAFTGFHDPTGLHVSIFLLSGLVPLRIFIEMLSKNIGLVDSNQALLTFPQITTLDLSLSTSLVGTVTHLTIMAFFFAGIVLAGVDFTLYDPMSFGFGLFGFFLFAYGFSLVFAALNLYVPVLGQIRPMITRALFFCSGIFYSVDRMARIVGEWITWNPLACYAELLRGTFLSTSPVPGARVDYLVVVTLLFLAFGLLFERYTRKKVLPE